MGSGIARQVRDQFPDAYAAYMEDHDRKCQLLGEISWARIPTFGDRQKIIVNAYTQEHYGGNMRQVNYEAIAECFEELKILAEEFNLKDAICFPAIGAGLGGGNWKIIERIIDETLPDSKGFRKYLYVLPEKT